MDQNLSTLKILRVDMGQASVTSEDLPMHWRLIGGSGLIAKIMNREVPPQFGRVSVGGKSPLTLGIKEANSRGPLGQKLDRLGIRDIVVEGAAAAGGCHCLYLANEEATLISTPEYAGLKVHALADPARKHRVKSALDSCE